MSKNLSHLSGRKGLDDGLFERMSQPDAERRALAEDFLIGTASVHGAASFYQFLDPQHRSKQVYICDGSACLCAGTQGPLRQALEQQLGTEAIGTMTCLGRCHENGAFHYRGKNYSGLSEREIQALLRDESLSMDSEHYHTGHIGSAVLTGRPPSPAELSALLAEVLHNRPQHWLEAIEKSGLRGRGGAGFPLGFKLRAAAEQPDGQKFIVCNADEGDPGAYSDRYLLEHRPHLVLFGLLLCARIVGASRGVLYIRGEYPQSIDTIQNAIDQWRSMSLLGEDILGSGFDFDFRLVQAQGAYICGEETALLNSLEGQRPEVRVRPPYPVQQGLFNKPTVISNVETLACVHRIVSQGGDAFAALGTARSSGTKLLSLDSHFNRPGVYEVDMGTPLSEVFEQLGQGFRTAVKAVHIGGPLGGLVPRQKIADLCVDFESFAEHGFLLGHASVVCVPADFSMAEYLRHLFAFAAHESCGKCFPCRLGTQRGLELFSAALETGALIDRALLDDLLDTLARGSLCGHGGGIPLPIRNALEHFADELNEVVQ